MKALCTEPDGAVERNVWPFTFTPEATLQLYEEASKFPILFGKKLESLDDFLAYFVTQNLSGDAEPTGLLWIVGDFLGMFYLEGITAEEATVHYTFFDRRHKGREPLVRMMVEHVFNKYKFTRLNAEIPAYVGMGPRLFAEKCGFRLEGRKRKASWWKGERFDTYCYGILPEDM